MRKRTKLENTISDVLATEEKSYDIPQVCERFGLEPGTEDEAFRSKRIYVKTRLKPLSNQKLLEVAIGVFRDYENPELAKLLEDEEEGGIFNISSLLRIEILRKIASLGNVEGKMKLIDFLNQSWDTNQLSSPLAIFDNALPATEGEEILNKMASGELDYFSLFTQKYNLPYLPDDEFIFFIERLVHPSVRPDDQVKDWILILSDLLNRAGFAFSPSELQSGFTGYKVVPISRGVGAKVKNIIFSADGPKPEIVFSDALHNQIEIVKNEEFCLIYNHPIPSIGLMWDDLVKWWTEENNLNGEKSENAKSLYRRLVRSIDQTSPPERLFFDTYYKTFYPKYQSKLPALIPQVYLHYDPLTIRQLKGKKRLVRQRMDFLLLLSNHSRIVFEIDGQQHYSENGKASPKLYSEMVAEDRRLKLAGYDIFRFGGKELMATNGADVIIDFFESFFKRFNPILI